MHEILKKYENTIMHQQLGTVWNKAKGIYELNKKKILDFISTIFVINLGCISSNHIHKVK